MGQPPVAVASTTPTFGATQGSDWEDAPVQLSRGTSIVALLRARGIPATRDILAAIAQANGIADFRSIPENTPIWLPRRTSIMGARAAAWRDAYRAITPDSFATVDRDREARKAVQGRAAERPLLPRPIAKVGPRPTGEALPAMAPPGVVDQGPAASDPAIMAAEGALPAVSVEAPPQPAPAPPAAVAAAPAPAPAAAPPAPALPAAAAQPQVAASAPPAAAAAEPSPQVQTPSQRLDQDAHALAAQLRGGHDVDAIMAITYDMMSNPNWTNEQARIAYAKAVTSNDPMQIIHDFRAAGLDYGQLLTVSDYVWNDEHTPFRGQVSAPIRVVRDAIGFASRPLAFGMADAGMENDLWEIVNGIGVDQANAVLASRVGPDFNGSASTLRLPGDPDNMSLRNRVASWFDFRHTRAPAPIDGHLEAAAPGTNQLEQIIRAEKNPLANPFGLFSSGPRDKWLAILRMPRGTSRAAFEVAFAASTAKGDDFIKLFEGKTAGEMAQINAAFTAGFGDTTDHTLAEHAYKILKPEQFKVFETLANGVRSDRHAAAAYICMQLRAHAGDAKALKDILTRNVGSTRAGGPTWNDIVLMDHQLDPMRADAQPLIAIIGSELAKDPVLDVIIRDQNDPNEPAGIARRVMASNNPKEIAALLKRTDGSYFNQQELAVMNQQATAIAGGDASKVPSALYDHVSQLCGPGSEPALILQQVAGLDVQIPAYDAIGRLAPAAQLFYALQRRDKDAIMSVLARTSFVDLGPLEESYPAIADAFAKAGITPPGNTTNVRDAVKAVLEGDDRDRAVSFLTGMNVTSFEATNATGAQLAQRVADDLASRWPWLTGQFDHEREPLRERLMQFQVTLSQVLSDVAARRQATGQPTGLTEAEQVRLGEAVALLISQQRDFQGERQEIATTMQNGAIIAATAIASLALTIGTAGAGAPASAALMSATATTIARTAIINGAVTAITGGVVGMATAPLMGGTARDYVNGGMKGFVYGGFVGLASAGRLADTALAPILPGKGALMTTLRQAAWNSVAVGGIYSSFDVSLDFDSSRYARDFAHGMVFGAGLAALAGLSKLASSVAANGATAAQQVQNGVYQVAPATFQQGLASYAQARDLATMERLFGNMTGGGVPTGPIVLDDASRAALSQGITRHLQALAAMPAQTAADVANQAQWMTVLTIYTNAAGIQLPSEALGSAMSVAQRLGYQIPAQLSAQAAQATMNTMAQDFMKRVAQQGAPQAAPQVAGAAEAAPVGPRAAAVAERGIRIGNPTNATTSSYRSWSAVSLKARSAGTRAVSLDEAMQTRRELTALQRMLNTPSGAESLAAMRSELGDITPAQLGGIRRSTIAAIGRVDKQLADMVSSDATTLVAKSVAANDPTELYTRIAKLQEYKALLATMRANGATLEVVNGAAPAVESAQASLDARLAKVFTSSVPTMATTDAERLRLVGAYRAYLAQSGFDHMAPATVNAVDTMLSQLSRTQRAAA